jgi:hypothetical protein
MLRGVVRGALAAAVVAASVLGTAVLSLGPSAAATALKTATVTFAASTASTAGQTVTYTVTVAGSSGVPSGTVDFEDGGTTIAGCGARALTSATGTSATATCAEPAGSMTGGTHTITVAYSGNSTYNPATGTLTGGQKVNAQSTGLSISSPASGSSTGVGASVTYTASLTFSTNPTFTPTGSVGFEDGATTISGCATESLVEVTSEEYTATCKEAGAKMTLGSHTITAGYTGDGNFASSTSAATYAHLVAQTSSAISLASGGPSSVVVGTKVTYSAVVSNPASTTATGIAPTGHARFTLPGGVTTCGSVTLTVDSPLSGESEAQCSVALPAGTYSSDIIATYTGDADYVGSGPSNAVSQTVTKATPTVAVTSSTTSDKAGVLVTYSATVTGVTGFPPTGAVSFGDASQPGWSCSSSTPSVAGDIATYECTETGKYMTAGSHTISASYSGSTNFGAKEASLAGGQQVAQNSSGISIAPSASPVYAGAPETWAVTVSGGTSDSVSPTGSVILTDTVSGSVVWRCTETLTPGSAGSSVTKGTCAEPGTLLTTGAHLVTATYGGDANFSAAATVTSTQTVTVDPVEITVSSSTQSGAPLGQPVTYTVHVSGLNGATVPPSGTVTVTDTSAPAPGFSCTGVVGTRGAPSSNVTTYSCTEPGTSLDQGTHVVEVTFNGDPYFASGGEAGYTQHVGTSTDVTVKIGTSGTPSYPGQQVTYTATVTGSTSFAPTGPVVFTNNLSGTAALSCTSTLSSMPKATSTGNATVYTCAASGQQMPEGSQTVTAEFEGAGGNDHNYPVDASASLTQVVSPDATTTSVTTDAAVALGVAPTYKTEVTPAHGTLPVEGTVKIYSGGVLVPGCTGSVVTDGVATCTPTTKPGAGSYSITAVFQGTSGDNYLASASASPATQVVDKAATTVTTVTDTTGVGPHPAGVEQTFTATVSTSVTGFTPTGTVTFSDPTGAICTAAVSSGAAMCSGYSAGYTVLGGQDTITATYNGDANFDSSAGATLGSKSPSFARTMPQKIAITNVDVDGRVIPETQNIASFAGQPVTYVATITGNGLVVPTGTVTFMDTAGSTKVWTATCTLAGGTVRCTEPGALLTTGAHTITATYKGDANYFTYTTATSKAPDSATYAQHVVTGLTTIKMTSAAPSPGVIQPVNGLVTLEASLSAHPAGGTRKLTSTGDGYVYFFDNGVLVPSCDGLAVTGTSVAGTARTATVTCTALLAEGTDIFTAAYEDTTDATGYSTARTTDNTTTPTTFGKPQAIDYTVVYYPTVTNVTAVATAGGGSPVAGQTTTISATVVPTAGATRLPTGTLAFVVNGNTVTCTGGSPTLNGSNPPAATCKTNDLPGGTDVIQAVYSTDGTYAASVGSYSLLVGKAPSTTIITAVTKTLPTTLPISGQPLQFAVKVTAAAPGSGIPTGTVTITAPGATGPLCTATLTGGSGSCTNSFVAAPAGTPTHFTATYSGDASFRTSTSTNTASMTIAHQQATFQSVAAATAADPSVKTVTYGQPITFTVTLSPQIPGSVATGSIAITGPSTGPSGTLCSITLTAVSDNTGSCTFTMSAASPDYVPGGTQVFTASYSGDQTFDPSASGGGGQVSVVILPATVDTAVTIAPQNPVYGQVPTFRFTVAPTSTGSTPAGTVTVTSSETGGTALCTAKLSGGAGTCKSSVMPPTAQDVKFYANYADTVDHDYKATTAETSPASGSVVANVLQATTTTTVTVTSSQKYGVGQTFHVSVAPQVTGSPSPSGTVAISAAGATQPLCPPIALSAGSGGDGPATGSCTSTVPVPAGTKITYTATYSGSTGFQPSSGTTSGKVTRASTSTTVSASPTPGTWGNEQAVVFTATVANTQSDSAGGSPTGGTVTVKQGGTVLCSTTVADGTATCSPTSTALVPGADSVTATYGGNANFATSTSTSHSITIDKASTTITLTPIPTSVVYGNESSVTFGFSVAPQYAAGDAPTGKVIVKEGTTPLCTTTLASGAGSCTATNTKLGAGTYTITATYTATGSADFNSSSASTGQSLKVTKASTTVSLVVSPASVASGKENVAGLITVTVVPQFVGTPAGTVTIKANGTHSTSTTLCGSVTLVTGKGTCPTLTRSKLPVGSYALVGAYGGNADFLVGSTSSGNLTVTTGSTTTTVTFSPSGGVTLGDETAGHFTPTVMPTGSGTPTGTVSVVATSTTTHTAYPLCSVPVAEANGSTSCSPSGNDVLPPGTYTVVASYPGDDNFASSSVTATTSLTVAKASASSLTLHLSSPTTTVTYGNESTATYSVNFGAAAPAPTGTVAVKSGGATMCSVTLATGGGSCTVTSPIALAVGATHAVTATYTGDPDYTGSVSSTTAVNLAVTKATSSPAITLSESSATFGDEGTVTFTVHVTPQYSGTPTGAVAVKAGVTSLCTVTLSNGTGTCSLANSKLGAASTPYSVTAVYDGDTNFTGASSPSQPLIVTKSTSTTTVVIATAAEAAAGQMTKVGFSATVTPELTGSTPAPTGTVTFTAADTTTHTTYPLCTFTLVGSPCKPSAGALPAGTYIVTGVYSGNGDYQGSTGATSLTVAKAASSVTSLSISQSSVAYGSEGAATFSVKVTPPPGGSGMPTGSVSVMAGAAVLCTVTLADGAGGCTTAAATLTAGSTPYTVTATYSGDTNFPPSTSSGDPLTVTKVATAAPSSVSPVSVRYGTEGTSVFSVTVLPVAGSGVPTGTVAVTSGTTPLCTIHLVDGSGTCHPSDTALAVSSSLYTVTSAYSGDTNFDPSSSSTDWQITIAGTSTALSVAPSSSPYGSESGSVLTATVSPATSGETTGTVTITSGTTLLCTLTLVPSDAGVVSCTLSNTYLPVVGSPYQLQASYSGDSDFTSSQSALEPLTITRGATSTSLRVSPTSVDYGNEQDATFSATVTSGTSGTPTGTVSVYAGLTLLCTFSLVIGTGSCSPALAALGVAGSPYTVTAEYSGGSNFVGSIDSTTFAVTKDTTTTTLVATPSTATYGAETATTFAVHVATAHGETLPGTESATVAVGSASCPVTLTPGSGGATGSCSIGDVALPVGGYTASVTYSGDTDLIGSSGTTAFAVVRAGTSTSLSVSPGSVQYGDEQDATFSATVTSDTSGTPTGTVSVETGTQVLCAVTLSDGSGSCSMSSAALAVLGSGYQVVADYSGDSNFTSSSSAPTQLTVTPASTTVSVTSSAHLTLPGHTVTFIATVSATPIGAGAPTGTVQFTDGSDVLCPAAPITGGQANCSQVAPVATQETVTATYSGSTDDSASSGSLSQQIQHGYWTVASDGGVFSFGDAQFYGSMGGRPLDKPVVGMVATATGGGYWLVASDGGVFAFGNAKYLGSGTVASSSPIVGLAAAADDQGYWLAAADGSVYSFGDAQFYGSMGGSSLVHPVVGIGATADGQGYWLVASDGGVFSFGDAFFDGSMGGLPLDSPMVSIAAL